MPIPNSRYLGFSLIAFVLSHVPFANAEIVPVSLEIDSSASDVTFSIAAAGDSDTDSSSISGTLESDWTIDPSSGAPNVTGLEFTGGQFQLDDSMSFDLTVFIFFNVHIESNDIAGFVDTPLPPGMVNLQTMDFLGYSFDAAEHEITFNEGTLEISGVASQTQDLSTDPTSGVPPVGSLGSIALTQGATTGNLTEFTALLTMPFDISDSIPVETDLGIVTVNFGAVGQMVASGSFMIDIGLGLTPGDFDGNGSVDGNDFLAWQNGFGIQSGATLAQGDANGDGKVDGNDFLVWQNNFGSGNGSAATAVPEPATLTLCILAMLLLNLKRFQKP